MEQRAVEVRPVHIITPFFCQKDLNSNAANLFKLTLKTVAETVEYPFQWTIIDNGSSDEVVKWLREEVEANPKVTNIIYNETNYGIGKACNQGVDAGPKDYIMKLDADMSFYKKGWLRELVWAVDNIPSAGAIGVSVEKSNYSIVTYEGKQFQNHRAHIGGACFLYPKRIHDLLGYWNEEYDPYGGTDGDFGMRVKYAGYKNLYLNDKEIVKHCYLEEVQMVKEVPGVYTNYKSGLRKKNTPILHKNLQAYDKKTKSLKFIRNVEGKVVNEGER